MEVHYPKTEMQVLNIMLCVICSRKTAERCWCADEERENKNSHPCCVEQFNYIQSNTQARKTLAHNRTHTISPLLALVKKAGIAPDLPRAAFAAL